MAFEKFSACSLLPLSIDTASCFKISQASDGTWKASSFYVDSSGRSTIRMPLELKFPSEDISRCLIGTGCFDSYLEPKDGDEKHEGTIAAETANKPETRSTFVIEAKVTLTFGTGEAIASVVEETWIRSASIVGESIHIDAHVTLRVIRNEAERVPSVESSRVKTRLEIGAVLVEKIAHDDQAVLATAGLRALNLGGFPDMDRPAAHQRQKIARIEPFELQVILTHALSISVASVPHELMGQTFVSLTMRHSNTHSENLTITNIALHPGHAVETLEKVSGGADPIVTDMSKVVKWMFAPDCDPNLPLEVGPYEAFSTVLLIDASEDRRARTFNAPISVTAVIGSSDGSVIYPIVAVSEAQWTTSRAPIDPSDSFRIDMKVGYGEATVGSPFTIFLELQNLSAEGRDVMILVDQNDSIVAGEEKGRAGKSVVVSEQAGDKFGIWGLLDDNKAGAGVSADRELLTLDVALLVGELKPKASCLAELRFIPLICGTVGIPNLKLVDRKRGKWYSASHHLRVTVNEAKV